MTKWKPKVGETYYLPWVCSGKENFRWTRWINDELDYSRYEAGIICESEKEAIEMAKKMLMVAEECVENDQY